MSEYTYKSQKEKELGGVTPPDKLVAAANMLENGLIVVGVRHHDPVMNAQIRASGQSHIKSVQGFIDNRGNFLTRRGAMSLYEDGRKKGWYKEKTTPENELFSEDLY